MVKNNHTNKSEPIFALFTNGFAALAAPVILELLHRQGEAQAKLNLAVGPLFRMAADSFRDWSKMAEPGCLFQAPEIGLHIIRLSGCPPVATALSETAQEEIRKAEQPDNLRIATG